MHISFKQMHTVSLIAPLLGWGFEDHQCYFQPRPRSQETSDGDHSTYHAREYLYKPRATKRERSATCVVHASPTEKKTTATAIVARKRKHGLRAMNGISSVRPLITVSIITICARFELYVNVSCKLQIKSYIFKINRQQATVTTKTYR